MILKSFIVEKNMSIIDLYIHKMKSYGFTNNQAREIVELVIEDKEFC